MHSKMVLSHLFEVGLLIMSANYITFTFSLNKIFPSVPVGPASRTVKLPIRIHLPPPAPAIQRRIQHLTQSQHLPRTIGVLLHELIPVLFPSSRACILAKPMVHGVSVRLSAPLKVLCETGGIYPDGWLNIVIVMLI